MLSKNLEDSKDDLLGKINNNAAVNCVPETEIGYTLWKKLLVSESLSALRKR